MRYSPGFKSRMVQRMTGPEPISANSLADETGVCQSTLSRWSREASYEVKKRGNGVQRSSDPSESRPVRPEDLPAAEKLRLLREASELPDDKLGAFLRSHGLHQAQLDEWRQKALDALQKPKKARRSMAGREAGARACRRALP